MTTELDGGSDRLPETHRTLVYRVEQETLTNCDRHSQAKHVRIAIHDSTAWVSAVIQHDGIGMEFENQPYPGIGLIGIEEQVRELGGSLHIESHTVKGALIRIEIHVILEEKS